MIFYNFLYYILFSALIECYTYKSYQYKIECEASSPILYPKTLEELQNIINKAIQSGDKIKVVGSRHSITDAICTDGIPIHMKHFDKISVNKEEGTVTLGAGLELMDAMDRLMKFGVTINNLPSFGGITVAGCVAMGVHGSSLQTPSNPSEYLTAVTFINGNGELKTIDDTDPDFNSFRVNLGLLGVFVSLTFKSTTMYKMKIENYKVGEELLTRTPNTLISMAENHNWFQFWWFPTSKSIVISKADEVDIDTPGNAHTNLVPNTFPSITTVTKVGLEAIQLANNSLAMNVIQDLTEEALYAPTVIKEYVFEEENGKFVNPAFGYSHKLMMSRCKKCAWNNFMIENLEILPEDFSLAFDIKHFSKVIADLEDLFDKFPTAFPLFGLIFRFSLPSRGVLAISKGVTTVHIDVTYPMRMDPFNSAPYQLQVMQSFIQLLFFKYGAKPHWGKNGLAYFSHSELKKRYSIPTFKRAVDRFDPNGLFSNLFGNRVLGIGHDRYTIPRRVEHCAIQDYCICKKDSDCAMFQKCGSLIGYPVCMSSSVLQPVGEVVGLVKDLL